MTVSVSSGQSPGATHDRRYHSLPIKAITRETADTSSFVLDIPAALEAAYRYESGQFLTVRASIGEHPVYRSYSMSSAPAVDSELAVTVKRVPGGIVSNWMNDALHIGDTVDVSVPAGVFLLAAGDRDVVAFAGGSGITPVFSIIKTALAVTPRRTHLLYANRDRDSIIFADELQGWDLRHPDRLEVTHHLDCDQGFVAPADIERYVDVARESDCYICGPAPFMDLVEASLLGGGVAAEQIHIERFAVSDPADAMQPTGADVDADDATAIQVTIELDGQRKTTTHHPGATILQTARQLGFTPPFSCESGSCATCMAKLIDGEVKMHVNDALYDDEVADGWILTCQSVPTTPTVGVVYGYEGT